MYVIQQVLIRCRFSCETLQDLGDIQRHIKNNASKAITSSLIELNTKKNISIESLLFPRDDCMLHFSFLLKKMLNE